jgi:uncharacterized membrane-anchored protein YjiN (DUF445 family)
MKNKKIADRLMIALILCFATTMLIRIYIYDNYFMDMLAFVIEAALVGGAADWFAVTALYKKPLGISYHTAIIPRNREKVIKAISSAVENELLSQQTLHNKIREVNFTDILIKFIDEHIKKDGYFYGSVKKYSVRILDSIDSDAIAVFMEKGIKKTLVEINTTNLLNKIFTHSTEHNSYEKPFQEFIDYITLKILSAGTKYEIIDILSKQVKENIESKKGVKKSLLRFAFNFAQDTKGINIEEAAESIQKEIGEILFKLKDLNNPLHIQMIDKVRESLEKFIKDDEAIYLIEIWKTTIIEEIQIKNEINNGIKDAIFAVKLIIENNILKGDSLPDNFKGSEDLRLYTENLVTLINWIKKQVTLYWEELKCDVKAKERIECYIKKLIFRVVKKEHSLIGDIVEKSLGNLTDDALNSFIEVKAGNDLHWIRINGCIVGAIFGLVVFLFVNEIYMPIITKIFFIP